MLNDYSQNLSYKGETKMFGLFDNTNALAMVLCLGLLNNLSINKKKHN